MTAKSKPDPLEQFIDHWVDDLMALSDTDFVLEAQEQGEDPEAIADEMRQIARDAAKQVGRKRLEGAKSALASRRRSPIGPSVVDLSMTDKQRIVARFTTNDQRLKGRLTLAARGREGATEEELDGVLEDLIALGVIDTSGNDL